jgi:glycosyltransferase involved in cell wall biosynthesis
MSLNKKILVLTDWYYPGFKAGGPIQSCRNLVLALKDSLEFYVFTSNTDLGEDEPYQGIQYDTWHCISQGENVYYGEQQTYSIKKFKSVINTIRPDVVYLNSMFSFRYTILPLLVIIFGKYHCKIVLAPRGMLNESALFYKSFKKKAFLRVFKFLGIDKKINFHATDPKEEKDIRRFFPKAKSITQAPNFAYQETPDRLIIEKISGVLKLVFISRITPVKNLAFLIDLLKSHTFPGIVQLTVAGEIEDKTYWQTCIDKVNSFPSNIKFEYAGAIKHEKLLDWLQQFHFLFLPTYGENFGHVIFEAFISGRPVIISDQTPWKDLQEKNIGWEIPLSDKQEFVNIIIESIKMNQTQYNMMSDHCAKFADDYRNNKDFNNIYLRLFAI